MSDFHKLVAAGPSRNKSDDHRAYHAQLKASQSGAVPMVQISLQELMALRAALPDQKLLPRGLTFDALRAASEARNPTFKNAKGETVHSGADWTMNDWFTAMTGEVGEAGNILKKIRRRDFTLDEARDQLASELADVVIYLDLLANKAGIDLGKAVIDTFNRKSDKLQLDLFLTPDGPVEHSSPQRGDLGGSNFQNEG